MQNQNIHININKININKLLTQELENPLHFSVNHDDLCFINSENKKTKSILIYNLEKDIKTIIKTDLNKKNIPQELMMSRVSIISGQQWYFFGQQNKETKIKSKAILYNLNEKDWIQIEQTGNIPLSFNKGSLCMLSQQWFAFYGGYNQNIQNLDQKIYLFNKQTKKWSILQGNYQMYIKARFQASICFNNNKIYLFGGKYYNNGKPIQLNDFYQLQITNLKNSDYIGSNLKILQNNINSYSSHEMSIINNNIIILGEINENKTQRYSIYSIDQRKWMYNELNRLLQSSIQLTYYTFQNQNIYQLIKYKNNQYQLSKIQIIINKTQQNTQVFIKDCQMCIQNKYKYAIFENQQSPHILQQMLDMMQFPFSAFGLLLDNSVLLGASSIKIQYQKQNQKISSEYIKIQDNGKCSWTEQEYIKTISNFCMDQDVILTACDKKTKKIVQKSNQLRQYGRNLKIGCLKIAKSFLVICFTSDQARFTLFQSYQNGYRIHYYSVFLSTGQLISPQMYESSIYIQNKHRNLIRQSLQHRIQKNIIYLFDLNFKQLNIRVQNNDIILGDFQKIEKVKKLKISPYQLIDVSLKTYINFLYLKTQTISGDFVIGQNIIEIYFQIILQTIDTLKKPDVLIQLEDPFQCNFKMAQFFYFLNKNQMSDFSSNGLLIYHKNRLVDRVSPKLGTLLQQICISESILQTTAFLGYVQIPESVPINMYKNAFTYTYILQKFYNRFIFVLQKLKSTYGVYRPYDDQILKRKRKTPTTIAQIYVQPYKRKSGCSTRRNPVIAEQQDENQVKQLQQ